MLGVWFPPARAQTHTHTLSHKDNCASMCKRSSGQEVGSHIVILLARGPAKARVGVRQRPALDAFQKEQRPFSNMKKLSFS